MGLSKKIKNKIILQNLTLVGVVTPSNFTKMYITALASVAGLEIKKYKSMIPAGEELSQQCLTNNITPISVNCVAVSSLSEFYLRA